MYSEKDLRNERWAHNNMNIELKCLCSGRATDHFREYSNAISDALKVTSYPNVFFQHDKVVTRLS